MMGLGKHKLRTKLEFASFSHCRNIKGDPKILGSSPSVGPRPFFCGYDFMTGLYKPKLRTKFEVASFSRCRNIKGVPQNFGELS